jgi:protocatechuate 3,4-dioxygenase beta subunit
MIPVIRANRTRNGVLIAVLYFVCLLTVAHSSPQQNSDRAAAQLGPSASIEGVVVKLGTSEPISGVDVELTRVEGTAAVPLALQIPQPVADATGARGGAGGNLQPAVPMPAAEVLPHVVTSENGKFAFRNLKPGKYTLAAARGGGDFSPVEYGQRDPRGHGIAFPVSDGQTMNDVKLEMVPTGSITGRVWDENGNPMAHASVTVFEGQYRNGSRKLKSVQAILTDEHGDYRLFWLPAGRYFVAVAAEDPQRRAAPIYIHVPGIAGARVQASPSVYTRRILPSGDVLEEAYGLVYYGDVLDWEKAQSIDLKPGETKTSVDVSMGAGKLRAWHIRGIMVSNTGQPVANQVLGATPRLEAFHPILSTATTDANGLFDLPGAISGDYFLSTSGGGTEIKVEDANLENVRLVVTNGVQISVQVTIEAGTTASADFDMTKVTVNIIPDAAIFAPPRYAIHPQKDGMFTQLIGRGDMHMTVSGLPTNMFVRSIRLGTSDVLANGFHLLTQGLVCTEITPAVPAAQNAPTGAVPNLPLPVTRCALPEKIEIVLAAGVGEVRGVVLNSNLNPMSNAVLALVPDSSVLRRRPDLYQSVNTDFDGQFQLQGVPAGDYKLFAWDYVEDGAWQDPDFLRDYEGSGKLIHVVAGGKLANEQVTAIPVRK